MKNNNSKIVLFLLPGVLLFLLVFGVPLVIIFYTSFTNWSIGLPITFNGINNYIELFKDSGFQKSLQNTLIWVFLQSSVHVIIGVLLALILVRKKFYWKFTRTVYMIPNIISSAALGMMFSIILNPQIGIINQILIKLGFSGHNWFIEKETSFWSVTLIWLLYAGTITLLIIAEINAIDEAIFEAAKIDGANEFQIALHIMIPQIRSIVGTCAVLGATSMLQKLDVLMMTTKGGPGNRTMNLPIYIYNSVLKNNNFSLANTASVVLISTGILVVSIISRIFNMEEKNAKGGE